MLMSSSSINDFVVCQPNGITSTGSGDHDHLVAGGGDDLFLQQRPAAALDQVEIGIELIRAVDGHVQPFRLVEADDLDAHLAGKLGGTGGGGHALDLEPVLAPQFA